MLYPEDIVLMAPLAGYTDIPFRRMLRRHGCHYAFTEMVDVDSLIYNTTKSLTYVDRDETDTWLGLQLVGRDPEGIKRLAPRLKTMNFDVIDFNLGCPAPKVAKKGEGALLARREPDLAVECIETLVEVVAPIPVTVKTRIISDCEVEPTLALMQRFANTGIQGLTIHGRMMERYYAGDVFFDAIRAVKESLQIPVIANGGVMGIDSYRLMREATTCSRVMVARGAQGNPWLFEELHQGDAYIPPTIDDLHQELSLYLEDVIRYYGETLGLRVARKTVLDFLKGRGFSGAVRAEISYLSTREDVKKLLAVVQEGPSAVYYQQMAGTTHVRRLREKV